MTHNWEMIRIGDLLTKNEEWIRLEPTQRYKEVTVRLRGKGVVLRREVTGADIAAGRRIVIRAQQFILSRIDARNGAFGLVPSWLDGAVVSGDFPSFKINTSLIVPRYLKWISKTAFFIDLCKMASVGTTNRIRLREDRFLEMEIRLPPLSEQHSILRRVEDLAQHIGESQTLKSESYAALQPMMHAKLDHILHPSKHTTVRMGDIADLIKRPSEFAEVESVRSVGVKWWGKGPYIAEEKISTALRAERFLVNANDLIYNDMWARHGSVGVVPEILDGCVASAHFPTWELDLDRVVPQFFAWCFRAPWFWAACEEKSQGSTGRNAISKTGFRELVMPLPDLLIQSRIVAYLDGLQAKVDALKQLQAQTQAELDALLPSVLDRAFRGQL